MIIYKAINLINQKIYIGQTINSLKYRANQHLRETKSAKKKNSYFHNAIKKYGFENFAFEEIDSATTIEELNEKEKYWIKYYNSTNKENGYNLDFGGSNGEKSNSTKRKIGDTTIEKWNNPEIAQKMRDGLKKATNVWVQQCVEQRVKFICPVCNKVLYLPKWEAEKRKTCGPSCGGKTDLQLQHMKNLGQIKHQKNIRDKRKLSAEILKWCHENSDLIINCPYNKITTTLKPMLEQFNIKDIRSIFICFDVSSRKELLTYLKNYVINENVC